MPRYSHRHTFLTQLMWRHNYTYTMAKRPDPKIAALKLRGCLNPRPDRVTDTPFQANDFFDARDLVQVKYEMLRRARVDGLPVVASAAAFGFSRPSYYQSQAALEREGLRGLVPARPGPRRAHKLSDDVLAFIERKMEGGAISRPTDLASLVQERFGRKVHPRSIERALARQEKKRRSPR